ncbi:MAG: HAD family hydrolase, partial [Bacillaceae bacterium]
KKEGLDELLQYLQANNIPMVVATSTYRKMALWILEKAGVLGYFKGIVCGDEVKESKPDPEIFVKACNLLGLQPEECIVIEDSENGLRAAHAAGIRTIFIKDLVTPVEEVLGKVHHQGKSLRDVITYLEKDPQ